MLSLSFPKIIKNVAWFRSEIYVLKTTFEVLIQIVNNNAEKVAFEKSHKININQKVNFDCYLLFNGYYHNKFKIYNKYL